LKGSTGLVVVHDSSQGGLDYIYSQGLLSFFVLAVELNRIATQM